MNKETRKHIAKIIDDLDGAKIALENIKYDEEEKRDNMPENLQNSERYEAFDEACDALDDAITSIDEAVDRLVAID